MKNEVMGLEDREATILTHSDYKVYCDYSILSTFCVQN